MQEADLLKREVMETPVAVNAAGLSSEAKAMFDLIAKRAYEIFESQGQTHGHDLEHWLQAETELFGRTPFDFDESPEGMTVLAEVRGFAPKELEVDLEPRRVTIIGKRLRSSEPKKDGKNASQKRISRMLRGVELPVEIDTQHVTALLSRGILELDMKKVVATEASQAQSSSTARSA